MASDIQGPQQPPIDNLSQDEPGYPDDLVVRAAARTPEQHQQRVRRHSEVRLEDWAEAERIIAEDSKRGRKAGT